MAERTIDYFSPRAPDRYARGATGIALVLTLLMPVTFVSFMLLRRAQLLQPDPYNNPYTDWSTGCLLGLPVLALADAITVVAWRRRIARPVLILALVVLGLAGVYVVSICTGLMRFVSP